ncbi:MAG TPA: DNA-3-methyladenine glycosylase 2 family protein [Candidatus Binatia bacterium]|nr:DNA-3-methyladenine glycosylase 2 family protein [Candidatus Binatia bacterium]
MRTFTLEPDSEFSLAAAASFGFGPNTGRPKPDGAEMRLAFVTDDLERHAGVQLRQRDGGSISGSVDSAADLDVVVEQVRRILSLDQPGDQWLGVGERDLVIGRLQRELPGLRPVLFHSPYEAAAWSILSARRHRTQAAALRTRISATLGRSFRLDGEDVHAFPTPAQLLGASSIPGVDPARLERLDGVARAALEGRLDARTLREMPPEAALGELQRLPGVGPTYATLILLRSTGAADAMTYAEPRLGSYVAHLYSLGHPEASREELAQISEGWRPFRTWAAVLIRVAGDRAGLPGSAFRSGHP